MGKTGNTLTASATRRSGLLSHTALLQKQDEDLATFLERGAGNTYFVGRPSVGGDQGAEMISTYYRRYFTTDKTTPLSGETDLLYEKVTILKRKKYLVD